MIHQIQSLVLAGAVLLLLPTSSGAQPPVPADEPLSSFDTLWSRVKTGDVVYVRDAQAQETTGIFAKVSDSTLSILVDGQLRDTPLADIRLIDRRGDSVRNGFLIGGGIGAVLGAVAFSDCSFDCVSPAVGAVILGLEFGGFGALIDFLIKGRTAIYRAPVVSRVSFVPHIGRDRQTLSVAYALP